MSAKSEKKLPEDGLPHRLTVMSTSMTFPTPFG
jgi:hypothetical protein